MPMPISTKVNAYREPMPQTQSSRVMRLIKTMLSPITKSVNATIDFFVWIFKTILNFPKEIFNKLFTLKKIQQDIESTKTSDVTLNDKSLSTANPSTIATLAKTKKEGLSEYKGSTQSSTYTHSSIPHKAHSSVNSKATLQETINQLIKPILKKYKSSTYTHSSIPRKAHISVNSKATLQETINQKITPILETINNIVGDRSVIFNTIFPKDKSLINLITRQPEGDNPRTIDIFSQHTEQLMKINLLLSEKKNFTITYLEEDENNNVIIHTAEIKFIENALEIVPKIELSAISPKNKRIILKDKQAEEQCNFIKLLINKSKEQANIIGHIANTAECIPNYTNNKYETLHDLYKSYNVDLKNFLYILGYFVNSSYIKNIAEKIKEIIKKVSPENAHLASNEQTTFNEMSEIQEEISALQEEKKTLLAKKNFIKVLCSKITKTLSQKTISQTEHTTIDSTLSEIRSTLNDTILDEHQLFSAIENTQNILQNTHNPEHMTQIIKDLYEQIEETLDEKIDKEILDFAAKKILDEIKLSEEFIENYKSKAQQIKAIKQSIKTKIQNYLSPISEEYMEKCMYTINKIDAENIDISRKIVTSHAYTKQEKSILANIVYNTIVNSLIDLDDTLTLSQTLEEEASKENLIKELQQAITTNDENTINEIITTLVSKYHRNIELHQEDDMPYIKELFAEHESQSKENETFAQEHEEYSSSKNESELIEELQQAIKSNDEKALHEATTKLANQYKKTESHIIEDKFYSDTEELNTEHELQDKEYEEYSSSNEEEKSIKNTLEYDATETEYTKTEEKINTISTKDESLKSTVPSSTLDDVNSTKTTTSNDQNLMSDKEEKKASQPLSTLSDTIADQHENTKDKEKEIIAT